MPRHFTIIAIAAACLLALTACDGDDKADNSKASATPSVDTSKIEKDLGIPPEPTGAKRTALIAALKAIDPQIVADEDKAISNARNQCQALHHGGQKPDYFAAQRFGNDQHPVSEANGKLINAALRKTLCP
ncbi:hypothetical protein [Streptomyces iranensis]|uniref:DUF732 domain-containing protein n=1 Tax=Streptomyces iranensis TaxID=576784 RepID=A0A061A4C2_9ACTN|nr:hypothetical protein [Streptomyces iranensis]MBP2064838.1 hypothetical protein [Streptomyces iranensis]CDR10224.1 predicted protein [Streptomyces iranensis]